MPQSNATSKTWEVCRNIRNTIRMSTAYKNHKKWTGPADPHQEHNPHKKHQKDKKHIESWETQYHYKKHKKCEHNEWQTWIFINCATAHIQKHRGLKCLYTHMRAHFYTSHRNKITLFFSSACILHPPQKSLPLLLASAILNWPIPL